MTAITFCKVKTFQNKIRLQIFAVILPIRRHFRTKRDSKYFAAILPKSIELFSHNFLQYFNILSHRFDRISPPFSWANWIVFTYFFCKLSKDFDNVDGSRAAGLTLPGLPLIWQNFAAAILLRQLNGFHVFSFLCKQFRRQQQDTIFCSRQAIKSLQKFSAWPIFILQIKCKHWEFVLISVSLKQAGKFTFHYCQNPVQFSEL